MTTAPTGHTGGMETFWNPDDDAEDPVQALWRLETEARAQTLLKDG